jgi:predicted Fe-S protein YdhL (DUF1289 family)
MDSIEHANNTNPCVGICASDNADMCIGCLRTQEERNEWYSQTNEWRNQVIVELKQREEDVFGRDI